VNFIVLKSICIPAWVESWGMDKEHRIFSANGSHRPFALEDLNLELLHQKLKRRSRIMDLTRLVKRRPFKEHEIFKHLFTLYFVCYYSIHQKCSDGDAESEDI
jgi:hypothetical protein